MIQRGYRKPIWLQLVLTFFFLRIDATGYYARFW
jgi:hypothetical protein